MNKRTLQAAIGVIILTISLVSWGALVDANQGKKDRSNGYYPKESLETVEYNGQAFAVHQTDRFMVVNQVLVHAVTNMILKDGTSVTTIFRDENNNPIGFEDFKDYQRVKVKGFVGSDGYTFAEKIQRIDNLPTDMMGPHTTPQ